MSQGPPAGTAASRAGPMTSYLPPQSDNGGGTYSSSTRTPALADWESVFGPGARDIKEDPMRNKRYQRYHLPDALKGVNPYLTDRIDGLITDTTESPFTSVRVMPYTFLEHPDAKIKWNVWSFDEGMANRVPYESAARVLTQSKQSFAGYTVRQGLAITMEHNFMMSDAGRTNFSNQLKQMVGSIQYTNDLDVHIALITAPSYARKISEKYFARDKNVWQRCREYVDLFGIMQKNPNALDILIEETKSTLKSWGAKDPSFLITNSKLTMQLTMVPEKTQFLTQGPDGIQRLKDGPNLAKYRGLDIIHSRSFATETGARPRDLFDRRVRVAEYYVINGVKIDEVDKLRVQMYDQSKDTMFTLKGSEILRHALLDNESDAFMQKRHVKKIHGTWSGISRAAVTLNMEITDYLKKFAVRSTVDQYVDYPIDSNQFPLTKFDHTRWENAQNAVSRINFDFYKKNRGTIFGPPLSNNMRNFLLEQVPEVQLPEDMARLNAVLLPLMGISVPAESYPWDGTRAACLVAFFGSRPFEDYNFSASIPLFKDPTNADNSITADDFIGYIESLSEENYISSLVDCMNTRIPSLKAGFRNPDAIDAEIGAIWESYTMTRQGLAAILNGIANRFMIEEYTVSGRVQEYEQAESAVVEQQLFDGVDEIDLVMLRPNIEHNMLGIVMGRGGKDDLGATFWGQTELSVYDDGMHGKWGMSYKYHERAIVLNEKNLMRCWDVAFNGYNGGCDDTFVSWKGDDEFRNSTNNLDQPYDGPSIVAMVFPKGKTSWPNPVMIRSPGQGGGPVSIDPDNVCNIDDVRMNVMSQDEKWSDRWAAYTSSGAFPDFSMLHHTRKDAGSNAHESVTEATSVAFQGTIKIDRMGNGNWEHIRGAGHLGDSYVGCASVREGKGFRQDGAPSSIRMI
jgi:hypothetical protein